MIPCAIVALIINKGKFLHDGKSALLGCTVGLLGAGGQLVLFKALTLGPSYIIYPFISMSPVIVITLAAVFLKEKDSIIAKVKETAIAEIVDELRRRFDMSLRAQEEKFMAREQETYKMFNDKQSNLEEVAAKAKKVREEQIEPARIKVKTFHEMLAPYFNAG